MGTKGTASKAGGAAFQTLGPGWPFLVGGLILGLLLVVSIWKIKPGREEHQHSGLARSASAD